MNNTALKKIILDSPGQLTSFHGLKQREHSTAANMWTTPCRTDRSLHKLHLPLLQSHPHPHPQAGILHQMNHLPREECPQTEEAATEQKQGDNFLRAR